MGSVAVLGEMSAIQRDSGVLEKWVKSNLGNSPKTVTNSCPSGGLSSAAEKHGSQFQLAVLRGGEEKRKKKKEADKKRLWSPGGQVGCQSVVRDFNSQINLILDQMKSAARRMREVI